MKKLVTIILLTLAHFSFAQTIEELDINVLRTKGLVTTTTSPSDLQLDNLFDKKLDNHSVSWMVNPVVVTIQFNHIQKFKSSTLYMEHGEWTIEAANTIADLDNKVGSYKELVSKAKPNEKQTFSEAKEAKIIRVTANELNGDKVVHLQEWLIETEVTLTALDIRTKTGTSVYPLKKEQLSLVGLDAIGNEYPINSGITWSTSNPSIATVNSQGLVNGVAVGDADITAKYLNLSDVQTMNVVADPNAPDLAIRFIKRTPEIDFVFNSSNPARQGWPQENQQVTWQAHVKNWSPDPVKDVAYAWKYNGVEVSWGTLDIEPYGEAIAPFNAVWKFKRDELTFEIDTDNAIAEVEEDNNSLTTWTDAITVGFYVEETLYEYFHQHQSKLGVNTNSWDDWAQMQVKKWNQYFSEAIYPESPNGVLDRIRIDEIHVVSDAALPLAGGLATNNPNLNDRTVDLQWGFPSTHLNSTFYKNHTAVSIHNAFYYEGSLFHELGHARYLIDIYGWNVHERGDGKQVAVRENGELVAGSEYLPYVWGDVVHVPDYDGYMASSYTKVGRHTAAALNLIKGQRALMGNCNSPGNLGSYVNDFPAQNTLTFKDQEGNALSNANIKVYRSIVNPEVTGWYVEYIDDVVDLEYTTNANGQISVGNTLFDANADIGRASTRGIVLLRIETTDGIVNYKFFESSHWNLAYWGGKTSFANHDITITLPPVANFTMDKSVTCPGETVQFTDMSSDNTTSWYWQFQNGTPATSTAKNPSVTFNQGGIQTVILTVSNSGGSDMTKRYVIAKATNPLPLQEDFEGDWTPGGWTLENPDNDDKKWFSSPWYSAFGVGNHSAAFDNYNKNRKGNRDRLVSPSYTLHDKHNIGLSFDLSYTRYSEHYHDSLIIYASTDCGASWERVYAKGNKALQTAPDKRVGNFYPTPNQWRTEYVDLSQYDDQESIQLAFENYSGWGQYLYVDNIHMREAPGGLVSGIEEEAQTEWKVYPNPNTGNFNINIEGVKDNTTLVVSNALGQVILEEQLQGNSQLIPVDLSAYEKGIYYVRLINSEETLLQRVTVR